MYDQLVGTITELSQQYGGPLFELHVTLLGEVEGPETEVMQKARNLAQGLRPFHIRLTTPAYQEHYFRALYLLAEETPSLLDAYTQARVYFAKSSSFHFQPHLSLLYGTYSLALKEEVIVRLRLPLPCQFEVSILHLIHASSRDPRDWSHDQTLSFGGKS